MYNLTITYFCIYMLSSAYRKNNSRAFKNLHANFAERGDAAYKIPGTLTRRRLDAGIMVIRMDFPMDLRIGM